MVTIARVLFQNLVQDQRSNEKMLFFKNKTSVTSMDSTKKLFLNFIFHFLRSSLQFRQIARAAFFAGKLVLFCFAWKF